MEFNYSLNYCDIDNFGDQLNPLIFKKILGLNLSYSDKSEASILGIGSLLDMMLVDSDTKFSNKPMMVFTTGFGFDAGGFFHNNKILFPEKFSRNLKIYALRGNFTKKRVENILKKNLKSVPVGDGGLLCSELIDLSSIKKIYNLGIVPHFADRDNEVFKQIKLEIPGSVILDVRKSPIDFMRDLAECEVIISTALHPLIAADSMRIPNKWIRISEKTTSRFKFLDYYSVFNLSPVPIDLLKNKFNKKMLLSIKQKYSITDKMVADIKKSLIDSANTLRNDIIGSVVPSYLDKNNKKILIVEPNPYHGEILPGFYFYFKKLNYHVDFLLRKETKKNDPFENFSNKSSLNRIFLSSDEMKSFLRNIPENYYDFIFFSSTAFWEINNYVGSYFSYLNFIPNAKFGIIGVEHNLNQGGTIYEDLLLNDGRLVTLSDFDKNFSKTIKVNPHYFGDLNKVHKDKNKTTTFLIVGRLTKDCKNLESLFFAIRDLVSNNIVNFRIEIISQTEPEIPKDLKRFFISHGYLKFKEMFKILERCDYLLPLLDPSLIEHKKYLRGTSSGTIQLSMGFNIPMVIDSIFGKRFGFNESNSIVYTNKEFYLGIVNAIKCAPEKYLKIKSNLKQKTLLIEKESLFNLSNLIEDLSSRKDSHLFLIRNLIDGQFAIDESNKKIELLIANNSDLIKETDDAKKQIENLIFKLNQIYSGRMWNMLLKYFYFRDLIIKKLQQKIGFRRHLKKYFLKAKLVLNKSLNGVSPSIENYEILSNDSNLKELSTWLEKRRDDSFDFFIFGITSFNYRHQRPQHIAEELSKNGHRVFYIENEFSLNVENGKRLIEINKQSENIYLVKLHSDQNYFIYNQKPNQSDVEHMINSLKKIINVAKVINPISKIDHPFWGNLRFKLSMPIIYDCMDDHSGFKENGNEISDLENDLISNSDLVLVSSDVLMKKISHKRKGKTIIVRNAGEYSHFIKATKKETKIPSDLKEVRSKYNSVIGYYGAVADWFDEDLIKKLATRYPKTAIVLVGLVTNEELKKISKKHKNIFLLGEKPYKELPNYLKFFDICTIPFKLIPLIKATNPVKIYEYLSAGKTVVATDMPELKPLKSLVYLASSHEKFISLVGKALKERTTKELTDARKSFAKNNTWEKRISSLNKDLFDQFFPSVSIILLSYGKWEFTKDCFKSLYERTFYPNFDTILIDNKSDDETVDFIKNNIDGKYPKLKVFYERKNTGFGGGNNIGMKKAKGEYIILLNNDTKLTPGWISRLVYHASRKGVGLVGPVTNNIGNESKIDIKYNPDDQIDIENKSRAYTSEHWGKLLDLDRIAAFCWIKSRETYEKIGGFDDLFFPAFFEDDDYCKRIKKAGLKIYCADDVFVNHFLSASTKADPATHNKMFIENKARFEKKWNEKWLPHKYRTGS